MIEKELKYNYIFFFAWRDYARPMLGSELYNHPQVHIYNYAFSGPSWQQRLFHLHTAYRINEKVDLPLKSIWFKKMYDKGFNNDLPLCFVYIGANTVRYDGGFVDYVRKRDPHNKVVVLQWDLIAKKVKYDFNIIRKKVDLAVTYDKAEADKYAIHYFQETCYSKPVEIPEHPTIKQDVYFLGAAKDRLDRLHAIYRYLTDRGVKCKFMIAGAPEDKRISGEGMEYITGISYEENVRNVIESKCVLEVVQEGSSDITLRVKEAIAYERRLITDCAAKLDEYFNPNQLIQFSDISQIDTDLAKAALPENGFPPKMDMNPLKRLYDIQEQLEKLNG